MNSFRKFACFLIVAAVSLSSHSLFAQQEVDPDHFDQQASKVQKAAPHHVKHAHSDVASKAKHHHGHAAA
jgi:hypothetical protein